LIPSCTNTTTYIAHRVQGRPEVVPLRQMTNLKGLCAPSAVSDRAEITSHSDALAYALDTAKCADLFGENFASSPAATSLVTAGLIHEAASMVGEDTPENIAELHEALTRRMEKVGKCLNKGSTVIDSCTGRYSPTQSGTRSLGDALKSMEEAATAMARELGSDRLRASVIENHVKPALWERLNRNLPDIFVSKTTASGRAGVSYDGTEPLDIGKYLTTSRMTELDGMINQGMEQGDFLGIQEALNAMLKVPAMVKQQIDEPPTKHTNSNTPPAPPLPRSLPSPPTAQGAGSQAWATGGTGTGGNVGNISVTSPTPIYPAHGAGGGISEAVALKLIDYADRTADRLIAANDRALHAKDELIDFLIHKSNEIGNQLTSVRNTQTESLDEGYDPGYASDDETDCPPEDMDTADVPPPPPPPLPPEVPEWQNGFSALRENIETFDRNSLERVKTRAPENWPGSELSNAIKTFIFDRNRLKHVETRPLKDRWPTSALLNDIQTFDKRNLRSIELHDSGSTASSSPPLRTQIMSQDDSDYLSYDNGSRTDRMEKERQLNEQVENDYRALRHRGGINQTQASSMGEFPVIYPRNLPAYTDDGFGSEDGLGGDGGGSAASYSLDDDGDVYVPIRKEGFGYTEETDPGVEAARKFDREFSKVKAEFDREFEEVPIRQTSGDASDGSGLHSEIPKAVGTFPERPYTLDRNLSFASSSNGRTGSGDIARRLLADTGVRDPAAFQSSVVVRTPSSPFQLYGGHSRSVTLTSSTSPEASRDHSGPSVDEALGKDAPAVDTAENWLKDTQRKVRSSGYDPRGGGVRQVLKGAS
jgi:hypothetical protein